ncbi:MAG: MmcQ/YjbR family DNA-binding protein [Solirubrobacteraceae bacterium]
MSSEKLKITSRAFPDDLLEEVLVVAKVDSRTVPPRMFTWIRDEPAALVVWFDSLEDKKALIASEADKFFTIPRYDGQPIVLVRLHAVDRDEIAELIDDSWRLRAPRSLTKDWSGRHDVS